ncbi:MAG: TIGR03915 family putative DNA repair protein [Vallitalea sp.]|jgi:probable DNA metabolism protein|nr:TIGR03915 family putative DNA repair protein [Vallitalea sp.]
MIYLYDGTLNGLFTCVYQHYYCEKATGIYCDEVYEKNLFEEEVLVETDEDKAMKVYNGIINKISHEAMKHVYYTYLSCEYKKDCYILGYLEYGFKVGYQVDNDHTHKYVHEVHKLSSKVAKEKHLLLGILRFQEVGKGLYAYVTPDNDVIELLAEHFADRLKNEQFIIHDRRRNKAVIYNKQDWFITDFHYNKNVMLSDREKDFQEMWKGYFEHIGIEERKNYKLQRRYVPTRYHKNIVEFK